MFLTPFPQREWIKLHIFGSSSSRWLKGVLVIMILIRVLHHHSPSLAPRVCHIPRTSATRLTASASRVLSDCVVIFGIFRQIHLLRPGVSAVQISAARGGGTLGLGIVPRILQEPWFSEGEGMIYNIIQLCRTIVQLKNMKNIDTLTF